MILQMQYYPLSGIKIQLELKIIAFEYIPFVGVYYILGVKWKFYSYI